MIFFLAYVKENLCLPQKPGGAHQRPRHPQRHVTYLQNYAWFCQVRHLYACVCVSYFKWQTSASLLLLQCPHSWRWEKIFGSSHHRFHPYGEPPQNTFITFFFSLVKIPKQNDLSLFHFILVIFLRCASSALGVFWPWLWAAVELLCGGQSHLLQPGAGVGAAHSC